MHIDHYSTSGAPRDAVGVVRAPAAATMIVFRRAHAVEYLLTFTAFWLVSIVAVLTRSNRLLCDSSGCPVTPAHPVVMVVCLGLGIGLCVLGLRQSRIERHRILPDGDRRFTMLRQPYSMGFARWSLVTSVMLFGLAVPSAVRAIRGPVR